VGISIWDKISVTILCDSCSFFRQASLALDVSNPRLVKKTSLGEKSIGC